ncbi:unnamed protein product [Clavelina lepadiformis]|uniref:Uncharacterized protein n=1 Tax=Clavelina lepadiformis TaxID=159417 RepID=A0ABP0F003_CLALP
MKVLAVGLFVLFSLLLVVLGEIPPPKKDPNSKDSDGFSAKPPAITEEQQKAFDQLMEEDPKLRQHFSETYLTKTRGELSEEEKQELEAIFKKKEEEEMKALTEKMDKYIKEQVDLQEERIRNMDPNERLKLIEQLRKELENVADRMSKKDEL